MPFTAYIIWDSKSSGSNDISDYTEGDDSYWAKESRYHGGTDWGENGKGLVHVGDYIPNLFRPQDFDYWVCTEPVKEAILEITDDIHFENTRLSRIVHPDNILHEGCYFDEYEDFVDDSDMEGVPNDPELMAKVPPLFNIIAPKADPLDLWPGKTNDELTKLFAKDVGEAHVQEVTALLKNLLFGHDAIDMIGGLILVESLYNRLELFLDKTYLHVTQRSIE